MAVEDLGPTPDDTEYKIVEEAEPTATDSPPDEIGGLVHPRVSGRRSGWQLEARCEDGSSHQIR